MFADKIDLTLEHLWAEAANFAEIESKYDEPALYGVTDGKAVGTYLEHKFTFHLMERYRFGAGNSANGIDLPSLNVDIKFTSIRQPQSSCPYKSARQKIYGLGYHLIVFVYEKVDDPFARTGRLNMMHTIFVDKGRTADFQTTRGLRQIIANEGNADDIVAFLQDRNLPVDEIEARNIAETILAEPPLQDAAFPPAPWWSPPAAKALSLRPPLRISCGAACAGP
ncbi:hypothetical protein SODG_005497 [Sodalis praecaptivus]